METDFINVIINACLYCVWAFYYIKKKGLCLNTYPMLLWALSSLASINYYVSEYRLYVFKDRISLIPYIYLFVLIWISFIPLIKFDYNKIRRIRVNTFIYQSISYVIIILSLLVLFQNVRYFMTHMLSASAFIDAYSAKMEGEKLNIFVGFSNSIMRYCKYFKGLIPLFFLLSFTPFVKANKLIKYGLFISLINLFLNYMNTSSRFALLTDFLLILFLYIMLYRYFKPNLRRVANIIGLSVAIVLVIGMTVITLQRFGESSGYSKSLDYTLSLYAGESFLNFNGDMWNMQNTADGQNCMAYFIDKINGEDICGRDYRSLERIVHRRMNVFYTFIGDYYTDLGRIGTVIFVFILTLIFSKLLRAKTIISVGTIILLSTYVKVLLFGFTYWTYLNYSMEFVVNIIVAVLFINSKNKVYDFNSNGDLQWRKVYS